MRYPLLKQGALQRSLIYVCVEVVARDVGKVDDVSDRYRMISRGVSLADL